MTGEQRRRTEAWDWLLPGFCLNHLVSSVKSFSRVGLFATPWTVAFQAPPSMGFSRQEYWSGLPFPSPGDLPDPGLALDTVEPRIWKKQAYYMEGQPHFLAWKIPWSEEPGRLQFMGSQRVRHHWAANTSNIWLCRKLVPLTLQAVQVWKVIWI